MLPEPQKVFVRPDETIVLKCPHCGRQREALAGYFKGKHKVNVKCCRSFQVLIEFRKGVRKQTNLRGTFCNQSQKEHEGDLLVKDLSVTGLCFTCYNYQRFEVGDEVIIEFILDDKHQSAIKKEVIIRNIRGSSVGCEFTGGHEYSHAGPLGHYIMHATP